MKETITFKNRDESSPIILPISYNHMVQAMIYSQLDSEVAEFLHEEGFRKEKRIYKLFAFSRLMGNFELDRGNESIKFKGPVKLVISSPYNDFSNSIGNGILKNQTIRLGRNHLEAKGLSVERELVESDQVLVMALSPITVYSTLLKEDGRKFTYFYHPKEKGFSEIIEGNLRNKYKAFYGKEAPEGEVTIEPMGQSKKSVINYKGFIIKGHSGKFKLKGPRGLLQMGVDAGLGAKNSQGLGCVRVIQEGR